MIQETHREWCRPGEELQPIIAPIIQNATRCSILLCNACLRDKDRRTSLHSATQASNEEYTDVLKENNINPGDDVSTDQYECKVKGRLAFIKDKEDPSKIFGKVHFL